jgi:hypothetical protein
MAIRRLESTDIDAESARDGGPHLFRVEFLPFDFTALEHVGHKSLQGSLLAKLKAEGFHMARQPSLPVANVGERISEPFPIPSEPRPVLKLMNVQSPHLLR